MKFFEKQKVDEIGIVGVKLQKILIFFMILNLFSFFQMSFWSWFSGITTMAVLYTGFYGAYKRRDRLVQFYFVVTVMFIVITAVAVLLSVSFAASRNDDSDPTVTPVNFITPMTNSSKVPPLTSQPKIAEGSAVAPLLDVSPASNSSIPNNPTTAEMHERVDGSMVLLVIFLFVLSIVLFALKISSLVLASRMVKMLRERQAHNLAHPIEKKSTPQHETQPMYQQVMYIPVPMQANNMNANGAPFTNVVYNPYMNPYMNPFQPQPPSSAPRQDV